MADNGGAGSTGVVAVLVIFVIIVVAALFVSVVESLAETRGLTSTFKRPSKT